jgi:hypothetical protein
MRGQSADFTSDSISITSSSISALTRQESLPSNFSSSRYGGASNVFASFASSSGGGSNTPPTDDQQHAQQGQPQRPSSASSGKGSRKGGGANSSSIALPGQLPSFKAGRVKVGIRCRPAFQDEIDFAQGNYMSIVETKPERPDNNLLGLVYLTLMSGKQREFQYDYVFGARDSQDSVYDRIARPVVTDVLKGFNGTIFAYVSPLYSLLLDMFSCVSM